MADATNTSFWNFCSFLRRRMLFFGRVSAVFAAAALFCLADGLYAAIREGSDSLNILPGQMIMISGPSPLNNPLDKDLSAQLIPPSDDLRFVFESFFASYWFGSAMWRGMLQADADPQPGKRELAIHFRGLPAKSSQKFVITVWENEAAQQAGAASVVRRFAGIGPELPGIPCGMLGLLFGFLTFLWGRRYVKTLAQNGYSEIFRTEMDAKGCRIFCLTYGLPVPQEGSLCRIFTQEGEKIGQAVMRTAAKGILEFNLSGDILSAKGCVVELRQQSNNFAKHKTGASHAALY